ncbi:MAG: hypothetical protein AAFN78_12015 [Pseudomonadota bacterium]
MNDNNVGELTPSKRNVHISFWGFHIAIALIFTIATAQSDSMLTAGLALAITVFAIWYFVAIGRYASRLGRSGILWGGLSFLFSPLGIWVSYIASFFVGPKAQD